MPEIDHQDDRYVTHRDRRMLRVRGGEETAEEREARETREREEQEQREREERERIAADPSLGPDGQPWDPERAGRTIRQQRESEAAAKADADAEREKREAAEAELKKYQDAELSDKERLEQEAEEARQREAAAEAREAAANERIRQATLLAELAKPEHGIVDAGAAAKLIDGVEYDDKDEPSNLGDPADEESLLGGFLKTHSFLKGKPPKPAPPSLDAPPDGDPPQVNLTAEELEAAEKAGMTPQQYEARKGVKTLDDWKRIRAQERETAQ